MCIRDSIEESGLTKAEIEERSNVKGVWFEEDYLRIYPFNEAACDTIGFTLSRDVADIGLESYYNSTLMGVDGRQYGYFNNNADVEQTIIEPVSYTHLRERIRSTGWRCDFIPFQCITYIKVFYEYVSSFSQSGTGI